MLDRSRPSIGGEHAESKGDAVSGNRLRLRGAHSLILFLSLVPVQSCGVAAPTNSRPPDASEAPGKNDLSGVWTGTSITGLHTLANEWTMAMRRESRHHVDVY